MKLNGKNLNPVHFREKYIKDILSADGDLKKIKKIMFPKQELAPPSEILNPTISEVAEYYYSFREKNFVENYPKRFNVNIFGSARSKEQDADYKHVQNLIKALAEEFKAGFISGGGPGIMKATNTAAVETRKNRASNGKPANIKSIGINLDLPFEKEEEDGSTNRRNIHKSFFTRIADMIDFAKGAYTAPGGIGSFFPEMGLVLQLKQVEHLEKEFPLVVNSMYEEILNSVYEVMYEVRNKKGLTEFINPDDLSKNIIVTDNIHEIVSSFKKAYDWWYEEFREPYKKISETRVS